MSSNKVAILQSNYIPWRGYFDIINSVDHFILLDSVQYTKNDWRNRNRIKTPTGVQWLTIAVNHTSLAQSIDEIEVSKNNWQVKHWKTLLNSYSKAPYFKSVTDRFEHIYLQQLSQVTRLSEINRILITEICSMLEIPARIIRDKDLDVGTGKTDRLIGLCKKVDATDYYSGPAAKAYLDEKEFQDAGINVHWMDYSGYEPYPQLYPPFENAVSIVDLIFNTGAEAKKYLKSNRSYA